MPGTKRWSLDAFLTVFYPVAMRIPETDGAAGPLRLS